MAKVKPGKSGGKQSITRHPLFPATVALWFGALFGIGSLAIRPSLIDGLIVSVGIDAIIPAAAPPMGVTTRILLALALAAIGGTLGAWLARRIAAPKAASAPRKRGAASAVAASSERARSAESTGSRRGRLALADEGKPRRDYVDSAPLPGHANILDVSQFDLDGFETEEPEGPESIEPVQHCQPESSAVATHWTPEPEARAVPQDAQVFQPVASEPEIVRQPAPPREPAQIFVREEMSQPEAPATAQTPGAEDAPPFSRSSGLAATQLAAAHCDQPGGFQPDPAVFAPPPPVEAPFAPPADRAPIAAPLDDAPFAGIGDRAPFAPSDAAAPVAAPADRAPFSAPGIGDRAQGEGATPTPMEFHGPDSRQEDEAAPLARLDGEPEYRHDPLPPKIRPGSIFDQKPATGLFTQPLSTPVSRVGWDSGMAREPVASARVTIESEPAVAPYPIDRPTKTAKAVEPPAERSFAAERIAAAPLGDLSPVELLERLALSMRRHRATATSSDGTQPENAQPVDAPCPHEPVAGETETIDETVAPAPPPIPVIPAALRPIGLDEDDDGDYLPALIPPRHFGKAPEIGAEAPAGVAAQVEQHDVARVEPHGDGRPEPGDAEALDEGYSSLLSLSRPGAGQQRFVRIEEPAPLSAEIEPVVVFPGKEPVSSEAPFARPSAPLAGAAGEQGTERAVRDPEETDRALRTALANIQRMSGAA